jgi:hypothetical protein
MEITFTLDPYLQMVHKFSYSFIKMLNSLLKTTIPIYVKGILLNGISALK